MAVGFFPTPYEDELLYGVIARFHQRIGYASARAVLRECFGSETVLSVVDFPTHIGAFCKSLPGNWTPAAVIDNHTLLPFYRPFLPRDRAERIKHDMIGDHHTSVHMRLGSLSATVRPNPVLRLCPECVRGDRQTYGEAYWHRVHQLPGLNVCPHHYVGLVDTPCRSAHRHSRQQFFVVPDSEALPSSVSDCSPMHGLQCALANDIGWLMEHPRLQVNLESLHLLYRDQLAGRGYLTGTGRIRMDLLHADFRAFFGDSVLERLQCGIEQAGETWLCRLLRRRTEAHSLLQYLLLVRFFDTDLRTLVATKRRGRPFGDAPWPCLNPVCDHYMSNGVTTCVIQRRSATERPHGTFSCESCGFTYTRLGPDQHPGDRLKRLRVIRFGPLWETEFHQLVASGERCVRPLARRLGVDPGTIARYLRAAPEMAPAATTRLDERSELLRKRHRATWCEGQAKGLTRTALRRKLPGTYTWLRRNDREWLDANQPVPASGVTSGQARVKWLARDEELREAIRAAAKALRQEPGRPVWVSANRIVTEARIRSLVARCHDKLPLTVAELQLLAETRVTFAIRRVGYVIQQAASRGEGISRWQLVKRAGLRPEVAEHPDVERILEHAGYALPLEQELEGRPWENARLDKALGQTRFAWNRGEG